MSLRSIVAVTLHAAAGLTSFVALILAYALSHRSHESLGKGLYGVGLLLTLHILPTHLMLIACGFYCPQSIRGMDIPSLWLPYCSARCSRPTAHHRAPGHVDVYEWLDTACRCRKEWRRCEAGSLGLCHDERCDVVGDGEGSWYLDATDIRMERVVDSSFGTSCAWETKSNSW